MRGAVALVTTAALSAALSVGPAEPALAATTTVGNGCSANAVEPFAALMVMSAKSPTNPLPITTTAGVITKVFFSLGAQGSRPTEVKVVHPTGLAGQYTVVASTPVLPVAPGATVFDTRLAVAAGDLLGTYSNGGSLGPLECSTGQPGDVLFRTNTDLAVGSTATFASSQASAALPLVVTIEPDVDGDGYGDETQDLCPQSIAFHSACPKVELAAFALGGRKISVRVTTDRTVPVSVTGTAKVHGGKVNLSGGTRQASPGALTTFTLKQPRALKKALAALPPRKSVRVTFTVAVAETGATPSAVTVTVKLPGTRSSLH